jgi:hypothetical protein
MCIFEPSLDGTLDPSSISDTAQEFQLLGSAAAGVIINGSGTTLGDGHTYRYTFSGKFTSGTVDFSFLNNTFFDSNALGNAAETETFTVLGVTAESTLASVAGISSLNLNRTIDVKFRPSSGQTLDLSTIIDNEPEFTLVGLAASRGDCQR